MLVVCELNLFSIMFLRDDCVDFEQKKRTLADEKAIDLGKGSIQSRKREGFQISSQKGTLSSSPEVGLTAGGVGVGVGEGVGARAAEGVTVMGEGTVGGGWLSAGLGFAGGPETGTTTPVEGTAGTWTVLATQSTC
jgi:hypothetical protein